MLSVKTESSLVDIPAFLRQTSLFDKLPESAIMHFAEKSHLKTHDKGKILFLQGDEAAWFFLVVKGWVKLFRETISGSEAIIDVLHNGAMFGEQSVFDDGHYPYSAEIVEQTRYIMLPTSLLKFHVEKHQQMALNLLSSMSQQQKRQNREIEHLNVQTAPQRIGCFLLRLCHSSSESPIQLHLPYDKTLIASRLGMKPETFSRALAKLKQDTDLVIQGSAITIPSVKKLVEYTCDHCSQGNIRLEETDK